MWFAAGSFCWQLTLLLVVVTASVALANQSRAATHKLPGGGEIKAVLLSASNDWMGYAGEADLCHAYQVLRGNGIPEKNIIVLMYDDIAFNELNPTKGVIINRPNGPNVYKNVKKDYTGKDVTKEVFFAVLRGNKSAVKGIGSGRVLESGSNDNVFFYHVGHGSPGILYMPDGDIIKSSELLEILNEMTESSRFHKMFFYLESCNSGSMFQFLPNNSNIFAMTSSGPYTLSSMCFCNQSQGIPYCLGSEFDYNWIRDAETVDLRKETVQLQFKKVRRETKNSTVHEYGDLNLSCTKTSEVVGYRKHLTPRYDDVCDKPLVSHQVPVVVLKHLIQATEEPKEKKRLKKKLQDLHQTRNDVVQFFKKLAEEALTPDYIDLYQEIISKEAELTKKNLACYENTVLYLNDNCLRLSNDPFIGTQLYIVINLCNVVTEDWLVETIQSVCLEQQYAK